MNNVIKYLYHYTNSNIALRFIVGGKKQIKANPLILMNDPKENKAKILSEIKELVNNPYLKRSSEKDIANTLEYLNDLIFYYSRIISFSIDKNNEEDDIMLSYGYAKPNMWNNYANQHKGVCICFDFEKLENLIKKQIKDGSEKDIQITFAFPVEYGLKPDEQIKKINIKKAKCASIHLIDEFSLNIFYYFFRKSSDWKNENEYRIVIQSLTDATIKDFCIKNCKKNEYCDRIKMLLKGPIIEQRFFYIEDSIYSIYLGEKISETAKNKFIKISKKYNFDLFQIQWNGGIPNKIKLI